ncbi:MAG: cache domain-containing protein [Desulfuromusa sp.]|nr:cache domain-containing protein [Desulfuromusa sp.]
MRENRIKLIRTFQLITIMALVFLATIIMFLNISTRSREFDQRVETMRTDYVAQQKALIKREVERVVELIYEQRSRSEQETQIMVKQRVFEASAIASNIYQQNKSTKSDNEIQRLIVDALRAIHFVQGSGYYFIVGLNGISYLHADHPAFEGTSVLDLQDTQGQFIIRDMIDIAMQPSEGFYEYHWTKPAVTGKEHKKVSYIKLFEPLGWFIGTGLYVEDMEAQIEADSLETISKIRFGKDGYIFINRLNGDALVANGKLISDNQKLWEVFVKNPGKTKSLFAQEYDAALKPDGDYIYYSMSKLTEPDKEFPKTSFIYGIPELQWLVGAGVYLDNVEVNIAALQIELERDQRSEIQRTILATGVIILFILFLFHLVSDRLKKDLVLFASFFDRAANKNEAIDRDQVRFEEFYRIAGNANTMLRDKNVTQEKLRSSEEKYRVFFENSANAMLMIRSGKFVDCNLAALNLLGYENKESFLYLSPENLSPELQSDGQWSSIKAYEMMQIAMTKGSHRFEWNHKQKNGENIPVEVSLTAVPVDGETLLHVVWWDISQRKHAAAALVESKNRFRDMTDMLPEAIFETNMEMKISYANRRAYDLFNFTNKDFVLGVHIQDVVVPDERKKAQDNIARRIQGEDFGLVEYCGLKKDGSTFPMLVHMIAIRSDQKIVGFRGVLVDITEQKQAEEEILKLRKLESVGVLAGGIAHDFNNLLAGLFGNIEMAKRSLSAEGKAYKYLDSAGMSMERATSLTRQLLTFAKGGDPIKETLSLESVITETATFTLRGSNVKPQFNIDPDLWLVAADKGQLSQVISNLAINAKQAMPDGGIIIISAENIEGLEDKRVQITVRDQGIGIAPQHLDKIFDPYFSTKQQGSGLGLASCYSIINKHDGTIVAASELNQGTTFTITLPAVAEQKETSATVAEGVSITDSATVSVHILVLDDEELVQQISGAMLEEMGHRVDYAVHGEETVEKYRSAQEKSQGYDVVICDLTIPGGMGGQEAAREILKLNPQAKIIVSSGYATDPVMANYAEYGFAGRVAKPYLFVELQKVVQQTLKV